MACPPPYGLAPIEYRLTLALWLASAFEIGAVCRARGLLLPMLFVGFSVLALPIIRNLTLLPPLALVILAPAWTEIAGWAGHRYADRRLRLVPWAAVALVVGGTVWLRLSDRLVTEADAAPARSGWGIDDARWGAGAVDFVEQHDLPGPLLNLFDNGGYLLYRLHPRRRVLIAGNTSMYPVRRFLADYNRLAKGAEASPDALHERYGAQTAVIDLSARGIDPLLQALAASDDWTLVHLDWAAAVWVQREAPTSAGLPAVDLDRRVPELLEHDRDLLRPLVPASLGGRPLPYPTLHLAHFLEITGHPALALEVANQLWREAPSERVALAAGRAALGAGRLADRVSQLDGAAARFPESEPLRVLLSLALAYRADASLTAGRLQEAEGDLLRMQTLTPEATGPLYGLAKIAVLRGEREHARRLLAEAERREPGTAWRQKVAADPVLRGLLSP